MSSSGLIMMISTVVIVTVVTIYLFRKVLKSPPRNEPDSFEDNDPK
jgi:hypothetical protein